MNCYRCKQPVNPGQRFCPGCGSSLTTTSSKSPVTGLVIGFLLFALIAVWWYVLTVDKPKPIGAETPVASETEEVLTIVPSDVIERFRQNSVAAVDWIKNKKVRMTAPVHSVGNNMFGGDRTAIDFIAEDGFIPIVFEFRFDKTYRSKVAQLAKGQSVTVEGYFDSETYNGLAFNATALY